MYPGASRAVRGTGLARAAGVGLETGESARDILLLFETRGPRLIPGAGGVTILLETVSVLWAVVWYSQFYSLLGKQRGHYTNVYFPLKLPQC